jgi:HK97 family phage major capsid protein
MNVSEDTTNSTTANITPVPTGNNPLLHDPSPQIEELTTKLKAAVAVMQESKTEDTARWEQAAVERKALTEQIHELKVKEERAARDADTDKAVDEMKALLSDLRKESKKAHIGSNVIVTPSAETPIDGRFLAAILDANSHDHERQQQGKAALTEMGSVFNDVPAESKATLGSTDATGGYIIPNNIVAELMVPGIFENPYRSLVTAINGVTVAGVDQPYRDALQARAVVAAWGSTKQNTNLTYNNYSATMYTLARVHDVAKQFLAKSAGAAQQDVLGELRQAFAKGEAYYIREGSGSSEPYGFMTGLITDPPFSPTTTSSFTAAATLAGSISKAIATAAGALGARDRTGGLSAILSAGDYWDLASEGTNEAGFYYGAAGAAPTQGTGLMFRGIPVFADSAFTSPRLVVGQFGALKVFYGTTYRVDSSDIAGTRWDQNLVGFRAEMEMACDARPAVYTGAFQYVADVVE